MFGTADGVYEATARTFVQDTGLSDLRRSPMNAETPVLWLGDFLGTKRSHTFIVQATGRGRFYIDMTDENGSDIGSVEVNLDRIEGDKKWGDAPLYQDYSYPFNHIFRGIRLRFRTEDKDVETDVTIISFAFLLHKEK